MGLKGTLSENLRNLSVSTSQLPRQYLRTPSSEFIVLLSTLQASFPLRHVFAFNRSSRYLAFTMPGEDHDSAAFWDPLSSRPRFVLLNVLRFVKRRRPRLLTSHPPIRLMRLRYLPCLCEQHPHPEMLPLPFMQPATSPEVGILPP